MDPRCRSVPLGRAFGGGGVSPGEGSRLLRLPDGPIAVAICYELADGRGLAAASGAGAEWLLASANLDPYPAMLQKQFAALAQLRAIEAGRWLVSSANTGPSLVVDAAGVVQERAPAGRATTLPVVVQRRREVTTYARCGDLALLLLAAAGTLISVRGKVRQS